MSVREYITIRRLADIDQTIDGERYLARTIIEQDPELIDIGVLDPDGNKIMARQKMNQIGFIRFVSRPT